MNTTGESTKLTNLVGRFVKWNSTDNAEIIDAWYFMKPQKAGDTTVAYTPMAYAVFKLKNGMIVTDSLQYKTLI